MWNLNDVPMNSSSLAAVRVFEIDLISVIYGISLTYSFHEALVISPRPINSEALSKWKIVHWLNNDLMHRLSTVGSDTNKKPQNW